jgi:hypothetical protein
VRERQRSVGEVEGGGGSREGVIVAVCHAVWFASPCRPCAPAARRPRAAPHLATAHTLRRIYVGSFRAQHECARGSARAKG